ncbi:MAG: hypothetical protein GX452_01770 [Ignavibacteriales bacterium]|nr:hypothetical protein [Ignavibacteriales bacterium]
MSSRKNENEESKENCCGKDWWGKRPLAGYGVSRDGMKFWKRLLHKKERWLGKKVTNEESE